MFNRKLLFISGLMLITVIAVGAFLWFVGPRWGWGPMMTMGRGMPMPMHPGMWADMPRFEGTMPHSRFGGMSVAWGGMLAFGVIRLAGWLLQIGLIVAIVMWLLRRTAPPLQPAQPGPSSSPGEPGAPTPS